MVWKIKFKKKIYLVELIARTKVVFHQRENKSMKITLDKCVLNVTPATNPTPMSKSDKSTLKTIKPKFDQKSILITFRESWVYIYIYMLIPLTDAERKGVQNDG